MAKAANVSNKKVRATSAEKAAEFTGYLFGGTSAIGTKHEMACFAHAALEEQQKVWINVSGCCGAVLGQAGAARHSVIRQRNRTSPPQQGGSRELVVSVLRADLEKVVQGGITYYDLAK